MCGIAGIYAYRETAAPVSGEELMRIREAMSDRGPDGAGAWLSTNGRVGLAHRRLAIIDLSPGGAQPMSTADGRYHITFNGEIYNYQPLRRELEAEGCVFRSASDTEVILQLYARHGAGVVHRLRGMFAFGIWDGKDQELFLARDPLGVKPLYYCDDGKALRFASSVEALVKAGEVDTREDVAGIAGFYMFGAVPDPFTFYRAVRSLAAGSTMRIGRDKPRVPERYFSVREVFLAAEAEPSRLDARQAQERISEVLRDSMDHHMVSDVPVGIFLSSGVDSSVLATLGAELSRTKLHAITLGFKEYQGTPDDETPIAAQTSRSLGIRHTVDWIQRSDFSGEWQRFIAAMDQASIDGVNSYLVAKSAASHGLKVAISGLGGDELFSGYPSFRDVPRMRKWVPSLSHAGVAIRALSAPLLGLVTSPKYAGVLEYGSTYAGAYLLRRALHMPWEIPRLLGHDRSAEALGTLRPVAELDGLIAGLRNERCILAALELSWYMRHQLLRDSDWAGMAHGVEIRVPFADVEVVRALAPIIAGGNPPTKAHLSHSAAAPLAREILERKKTGFSVPVREWLRADLPAEFQLRGLRGWARAVARQKGGRRFLCFLTDAYGCHGGIALYNRDLLQSLCSSRVFASGVAIPRHMPHTPEPIPPKLSYLRDSVGGKLSYVLAAFRLLRRDRGFDVVLCAHINLLPFAYVASRFLKVPIVLFIYGIEAWKPTRSWLANALARRANWVVSISKVTALCFKSWASESGRELMLLPNAIHADWYGPGAKSASLLARYGLGDKTVLMTLGRLESRERYKGFDEVLDALPALAGSIPSIAYLIVGDGTDRARLELKAASLGIGDRVVFTGSIPEHEKADYYRLADAFVMPSRGEGFGFVLLEAMACGIPVIASTLDGGREAVREGELGILVDPGDQPQLIRAVVQALAAPRGAVPKGLEHFAFHNFESRAHELVGRVLASADPFRQS